MAMKTLTASNSKAGQMSFGQAADSQAAGRTGSRGPAATLAALLLVCAAGLGSLYYGTMGFQVVATEDARRLAIRRQPLALPAAAIHQPQADTLSAMLRGDGRVAIVTFFYANCNAVCSVLGSQFQQLQQQIRSRGLERQVRLISISFDPRDSQPQLAAYALRQHADPAIWQFVSIDRDAERKALLAAAGIVVLPAPLGEFQHNAAFHLVDAQGRLVRIVDDDTPLQALEDAAGMAQRTQAALAGAGGALGATQASR